MNQEVVFRVFQASVSYKTILMNQEDTSIVTRSLPETDFSQQMFCKFLSNFRFRLICEINNGNFFK